MTVVIPKPNHPWKTSFSLVNGKAQRDVFSKWRYLANYWGVSPKARERLEWLIFYQTVAKKNARLTAAYFGISSKTFHKMSG